MYVKTWSFSKTAFFFYIPHHVDNWYDIADNVWECVGVGDGMGLSGV